jgi:hypothetical protein
LAHSEVDKITHRKRNFFCRSPLDVPLWFHVKAKKCEIQATFSPGAENNMSKYFPIAFKHAGMRKKNL